MEAAMKNEIFWLTLTILMTSFFWLPYIINRILENDLIPALRNPNRDEPAQNMWANRMMHAHTNAVENLVLFAPLVILVEMLQLNNDNTSLACMVFFFTRLGHFLTYSFGIPYIRTLFFFIGFLVQGYLALNILQAIG